jgi:hypothetical protein
VESFPPLLTAPEGTGEFYHKTIQPFKGATQSERIGLIMKSILNELYMGNIGFDSWTYGKDSPYVKAAQKQLTSMESLVATLNDSQKELFDSYTEAQGDMAAITRYDSYTEALKFGILFMLEVLTERGADQ